MGAQKRPVEVDMSEFRPLRLLVLASLLALPATTAEEQAAIEEGFPAEWFYARGAQAIHVGSSMKLLDAGDYDGDGRSEVLFWIERYNNDGYALYWNDSDRSQRERPLHEQPDGLKNRRIA